MKDLVVVVVEALALSGVGGDFEENDDDDDDDLF